MGVAGPDKQLDVCDAERVYPCEICLYWRVVSPTGHSLVILVHQTSSISVALVVRLMRVFQKGQRVIPRDYFAVGLDYTFAKVVYGRAFGDSVKKTFRMRVMNSRKKTNSEYPLNGEPAQKYERCDKSFGLALSWTAA